MLIIRPEAGDRIPFRPRRFETLKEAVIDEKSRFFQEAFR